ncbi:MAG TPA: polysaccharide biosynthesis C-terminal domain-containing protein [Candidatus Limnocylindria bacterium]|nr:polysaccharide biosynthesis C-terminal domain-containing protein [Candidatus Limnocylindria bacterium]
MPSPRAELWRNRSLRFALAGGATIATAVFGIARNKWVAQHLSTSGVGELAQVLSAQTWLGTATGMGLSLPIAQAIGAATAARDELAVRRTMWTALVQVGGAALAIVAMGLLFAPWLSRALLGTDTRAALMRISMLGVAGLALSQAASGLFSGRSDVRTPLTQVVVGGITAVAVTIALVPRAGLVGGAIGAAVLLPAGLAGAFWLHRRDYRSAFVPRPRPSFDPGTARRLLPVGLAALTLALVDQGTLLAVRSHFLRVNGIPANGLLQAALALSQQVGGVFYSYLASYAFGRISGAGGATGIRDYTQRQWAPVLGVAAVAFVAAMLLASPLLHLFYSERFDPARPMMAWALFGEFCKVLVQVWALGALPLGGRRLWMPIGLAYPVALAAAYLLLAPGRGALSVPLATAAAGLVQLGLTGALMSRHGVALRASDFALLVVAVSGLGLLAWMLAK